MEAAIIDRIEAAMRKPLFVDGTKDHKPLAVVPTGFALQALDGYLKQPERVDQSTVVLTAADFLVYWNRFKTPNSVVFADERTACYLGIVDFHSADGVPAWAEHRISYRAIHTPEWETWIGRSSKKMPQGEFAEFIEENYIDVVAPDHATMIEISTSLQAHKEVKFSQALKLATGQQQLSYEEVIRGSVGAGKMTVPDRFTIRVPVFLGTQPVTVDALLRFRIVDGKLVIWYDLHRAQKAVEAATQEITAIIRPGVDAKVFFLGAPG